MSLKRCLHVAVAGIFLIHSLPSYSIANALSEVDRKEWSQVDEALQKEYRNLLAAGVLPSEAKTLLYDEFEAHGCNGSVANAAIEAHQRNARADSDRPEYENDYSLDKLNSEEFHPLEKDELVNIYSLVDYSSQCARTFALATAVGTGEVNATNFLPENEYANNDNQRALSPFLGQLIAGVVSAITAGVVTYVAEGNQRETEKELDEVKKELDSVRAEIKVLQTQIQEDQSRHREELREKERELKAKEEQLKRREEDLEVKKQEIAEKSPELDKNKKEEPETPPGEEDPQEKYCSECAWNQRDHLFSIFREQVLHEVSSCVDRAQIQNSFPLDLAEPMDLQDYSQFTRAIAPSASMALKARTCDKTELKKSLGQLSVARTEALCNFHVETVNECRIRIGQQHPILAGSDSEKNEFLGNDCSLLTYPHTWKKGEPPIQTADDCRYLQEKASPSHATELLRKRQDAERPFNVLSSEECHPEIAKEYQKNGAGGPVTDAANTQYDISKTIEAVAAVKEGDYKKASEIFDEIDSERKKKFSDESRDYRIRSSKIAYDATLTTEEKEKEQCLLDQQMWAMDKLFSGIPDAPEVNKNNSENKH